jgi:hypothetical protein
MSPSEPRSSRRGWKAVDAVWSIDTRFSMHSWINLRPPRVWTDSASPSFPQLFSLAVAAAQFLGAHSSVVLQMAPRDPRLFLVPIPFSGLLGAAVGDLDPCAAQCEVV